MNWNILRMPLLVATCGSILLLLGKVALSNGETETQTQTLPTSVPLPAWELVRHTALQPPESALQEQVAGMRYQYRQGQHTLTVELRYLVEVDPEVRNLLLKYDKPTATVPFLSTIQQDAETGYFSLFADSQTAHLTSCINVRGAPTVTEPQFTQNRYRHDFRLDRLLPVLVGQETLRDGRCLWTYMSIDRSGKSTDEVYRILQETWADWYRWWQPRFPKP